MSLPTGFRMADVNRGNRPLSPHLQIYKPEFHMVLSALHRITGIALTGGAVLVVLWLFAAASSAEAFALVDGLMTSWIGNLVLLGCTVILWYHAVNGIRHLAWDAGLGFEKDMIDRSGKIVLAVTATLTLLTIIFA